MFYVAKTGNDSWSGRLAQANAAGTDGPFATLQRAVAAARDAQGTPCSPRTPMIIKIQGGDYVLDAPVRLTKEHSGTPDAPLVIRAAAGQTVRLMGGREIGGFEPVRDPSVLSRFPENARPHVLQCDLKAKGIADFGQLRSRGFGRPATPAHLELFFNDQPMTLARWPNDDFCRIANIPAGAGGDDGHGETLGKLEEGFHYGGDRPSTWKDLGDVWIHGYWAWDWANSYEKIQSVDPAKRLLKTEKPYGLYGFRTGQRFYYLNVMEELDSPGEYFVDRSRGMLYFWPPAPMKGARVVASCQEEPLIRIDGAAHVQIVGLTLECTRGQAVVMREAENCLLAGCTIRNIGSYAVTIENGHGNRVASCDIYNTGDGGVSASGGDRNTLARADHVIRNNHFHHIGRWSRCYCPAAIVSGVGITVSNNLIHDHPHTAILFGGNDHLIDRNEIYDVALETGDVGAIYTGRNWTWRGNVVRYNFVHDVGGFSGDANGIYMDDCVSGTEIFGNILYKVPRAMLLGGGRDFRVENNIFVDCPVGIALDGRGVNPAPVWHDMIYEYMKDELAKIDWRNPPYSTRYPEIQTLEKYYADTKGVPPENNLFARNICVGGRFLSTTWGAGDQAYKATDNLTDQDPQFAGLAWMDFRLAGDSPARKLSFQPIPLEEIGLVKDEYRPAPAKVTSSLQAMEAAGGMFRLKVHLKNWGTAESSGTARLVFPAPARNSLTSGGEVKYRLKPGQAMEKVFETRAPGGNFRVRLIGSDAAFRPSRLDVHMPLGINRIKAISSAGQVASALAKQPSLAMPPRPEEPLAEIRLALAGEFLAIAAHVTDARMATGEQPWDGSCIEVFGSGGPSAEIGQVFLLPAIKDSQAKLLRAANDGGDLKQVPVDGAAVETCAADGGYEIQALIPLSSLQLKPGDKAFLLEFQLTSHRPDGSLIRARLGGHGQGSASGTTAAYLQIVAQE